MPRKLRTVFNFNQQRFMQISESHCGPAVIQMLLTRRGVEATQQEVAEAGLLQTQRDEANSARGKAVLQQEIAEAGGASNLIEMNGMRVDQLALAVHRIAPRLFFYFKDHASIDELVRVVNDYHYPAGVEWQGVFEDEDEDEYDEASDGQVELLEDGESEDSDYGHYSLVTRADRRKRHLIITDPYKDYFSQARVFDYAEFDQRW